MLIKLYTLNTSPQMGWINVQEIEHYCVRVSDRIIRHRLTACGLTLSAIFQWLKMGDIRGPINDNKFRSRSRS